MLPFVGFTFTDPLDFAPVGLILLTLPAIVLRHSRRPYPLRWVRFAKYSAATLAVLTPLAPLVALYLMAHRASVLLGHWPIPMINDPKFIFPDDAAFQTLSSALTYMLAFSGWGFLAFGALLLHLRHHLLLRQKLCLLGIFLVGWLSLVAEPRHMYLWLLD